MVIDLQKTWEKAQAYYHSHRQEILFFLIAFIVGYMLGR